MISLKMKSWYTELDHKHLWHPFTQMEEWLSEEPLVIERGEGSYLFDENGKRYIDATSSVWCVAHGHNHPHINKAIAEQLSKISHSTLLGLSNVPSIRLAEKLVSILPQGLTRIFYADSGAAAVEAALKMAVQYWALQGQTRTEFLSLANAYHGDTFGSMSVGFSETFHESFKQMVFKSHSFPTPYILAGTYSEGVCPNTFKEPATEAELQSLLQVEQILKENGDKIAACIVEPLVQGAAGIHPHSPQYLKKLYDLVKSYGVLFVADEVAVGFGRTGSMFAVEQAGIHPDFLCLGKALTGGYLPVSVTTTTEEVFNAFRGQFSDFKHFFHGHTFTGNPLGCAAGIASLEIFEKEETLKKLKPKIEFLWRFLNERIAPLPHVREVRGRGFFAGIELGKSKTESYPVEFRAGKKVTMAARKHGIILRPLLDTIVIAPPLNSSSETLNLLLEGLLESIKVLGTGP